MEGMEFPGTDLEVRVLNLKGNNYLPSALPYGRFVLLLSGEGRFIKGQNTGNVKAPVSGFVRRGELFGFFPEKESSLVVVGRKLPARRKIETMDLRPLEPYKRHALVIEKFRELKEGDTFNIINDHDPLPLYFQMNMFFPGKVSWFYVHSEGDHWEVNVGRIE